MWTCKLVSHDCQAEWKANNPSAVTFSGCRALWGKRVYSYVFLMEAYSELEEVLKTAEVTIRRPVGEFGPQNCIIYQSPR